MEIEATEIEWALEREWAKMNARKKRCIRGVIKWKEEWSENERRNMKCVECFFFSSRRRHPRCWRDWSSDVCSSDLHAATLVHDDVLDAASLRRGRPTVVATAGRRMATATGDLLFSRAFAELAANEDADQLRALSRASSALARGEVLQREDAFDAGVSVERYLLRCELKTAALFEAACELGALTAGREVAPLAAFGRRIGLAFQLLDDVLDVSGPAERTGKHRGTDLLDGTITLPFILARQRIDPRTITTPEQAERVCDDIAATGALELARQRALDIVEEAKRELPDLP